MEYQTVIQCDVPRIKCTEHGVLKVRVPWAEPLSRYTMAFESCVIDWLHDASVSTVADNLGIAWNAVDNIMRRAVERGMHRRKKSRPKHIAIDETSFQKRHEYVSVVTNQETGAVDYVADGRTEEALSPYYQELGISGCSRIQSVSMDMWPAYINATTNYVKDAESKICFDKFHVAQHLGTAVDKVRRTEHRELMQAGDERLKGTKFYWLMNPENMSKEIDDEFRQIRNSTLRTSTAWAVKEHAMCLWDYVSKTWAEKAWRKWIELADSTQMPSLIKVATTVSNHLWGIVNAIVLRKSNAVAESINSKIQRLKARARGFRNRERFKSAIMFHCGKLDLYPEF